MTRADRWVRALLTVILLTAGLSGALWFATNLLVPDGSVIAVPLPSARELDVNIFPTPSGVLIGLWVQNYTAGTNTRIAALSLSVLTILGIMLLVLAATLILTTTHKSPSG